MIKLSDLKVRPLYRLRVRQRLAVLEFAASEGTKAASRRFGMSSRTIRRWRVRWRNEGLSGLVPRYPPRRIPRLRAEVIELIRQARQELGYGAARTRVWLVRLHQVRLAQGTIQRIFRDLGLPRLRRTKKRLPRQLKLFERPEPGDCVQVDVKFVRIGSRWAFQYTALDDCTRYRVLRLYQRLNPMSSLSFLGELRRAFPFSIRRLQCDNGREFPLAFALAVEAAGIRHRYIRPRRPQQNGKVERSHRIDHEEFWSRQPPSSFEDASLALRAWETVYNFHRFSLALQGRTPAEKLAARLSPPAA